MNKLASPPTPLQMGEGSGMFVCFMQAKVGGSFVNLYRLPREVKLKSPANSEIK